jgi:hypothetical protein
VQRQHRGFLVLAVRAGKLRHSRLTHLGEQNVAAPLLMAISGHKRLATLQQYVKPGDEAVAALLTELDPDRRR